MVIKKSCYKNKINYIKLHIISTIFVTKNSNHIVYIFSDHEIKLIENNISVNVEDKTTKHILDSTSNSNIKIAPLFRMVSIPDEQVPGLNHLVNRPQSWVPQPRSKRPTRGISLNHFNILIKYKINLHLLVIPEEDINETAHSVSSQMGNKEMSGFTLFAKETRIKSIYINNYFN